MPTVGKTAQKAAERCLGTLTGAPYLNAAASAVDEALAGWQLRAVLQLAASKSSRRDDVVHVAWTSKQRVLRSTTCFAP